MKNTIMFFIAIICIPISLWLLWDDPVNYFIIGVPLFMIGFISAVIVFSNTAKKLID